MFFGFIIFVVALIVERFIIVFTIAFAIFTAISTFASTIIANELMTIFIIEEIICAITIITQSFFAFPRKPYI